MPIGDEQCAVAPAAGRKGILHVDQLRDHPLGVAEIAAGILADDELLLSEDVPRQLSPQLDRLLGVGNCFQPTAEFRARLRPAVVEARQGTIVQAGGRLDRGLSLQLGDAHWVELFLIQDRGDVGNAARRGDEGWRLSHRDGRRDAGQQAGRDGKRQPEHELLGAINDDI